jgi:hypothetical protein
MMGKSLYRYFDHWKQVNEGHKEKLRTTLKDRIIKAYLLMLRTTFNLWRLRRDEVKTEQK